MKRYDANKEILKILTTLVDACPDMRFSQLLINSNIVIAESDEFYLESNALLNRIKENNLVKVVLK